MAAEITISLAIEKLQLLIRRTEIVDPRLPIRVKQLIEMLTVSQKFLESSEDDQGSRLKIDHWKIKLLQAVYLAEDTIDTFLIRTSSQKQKVFPFIHLKPADMQCRFSHDMAKVTDQLTEMLTKNRFSKSYELPLQTNTSDIGMEDIVKTEKQLEKLILRRDSSLFLMSTAGNAAVSEKTRLLLKICNSADIENHFQCRAWIVLSEGFEEKELVIDLTERLTGVKEKEELELTLLKGRLRNFLMWKRYIVVLYNLQTPEVWDLLKFVFPNSLIGSRVILSFREADAARHIPKARFFEMEYMQQPSTQSDDVGDAIESIGSVVSYEGQESKITSYHLDEGATIVGDGIQIIESELPHDSQNLKTTSHQSHVEANIVGDRIETIESEVPYESQLLRRTSHHLDEETNIVGFYSEFIKLYGLIFGWKYQSLLIAVVGAAGSGKTTLVKKIYNSSDIKGWFHNRAWVCVSKVFEEKNLLVQILKQVTEVKDEEKLPLETLQEKLRNFLDRQRYLIVLDDVHTPAIWDKLQFAFPNSSNGSKVILTVRDPNVATHIDPSIPHLRLSPLTDEESWRLFLMTVRRDPSSEVFSKGQLREKILRNCGGLPLAICVLGGLLSTREFSYEAWLEVIEDTKQKKKKERVANDSRKHKAAGVNEQTDQQGDDAGGDENNSSSSDELDPSNILALGYQDLPSPLKACLNYLCLFLQSEPIRTGRLFQLWIAEGLVKPLTSDINASSTEPEDLVEKYLGELEGRHMIEVASRRLDGRPKACRVPGRLYDLLCPYAESMGYFHVHSNSDSNSKSPTRSIHRLSEQVDIQKNPPSDEEIQQLRSYISFNRRKGDKPADTIGNFLKKTITKRGFGLLTLLDLEGVYKPVLLPETLGKLPLLRYVGLRRTFLDSIPVSIGDIPCLETLDVKHTNITTLPISICKATNLRHLYMDGIRFEMSVHRSIPGYSLTKLQTLWGLVIGNSSHTINWLKGLRGLRKLGMTCHTNSLSNLADWLNEQTSLRSLRLRSVVHHSRPSKLYLRSMVMHEMLTDLYLVGELTEFNIRELPPNLRVLTLSVSQLSEDPMQILGQLEHLKVLRLFAKSYSKESMSCVPGGFSKLQLLKLWMLIELREWTIDKGAMPALIELEIRCCRKLQKPVGLENVTTLKKLTLTNMTADFVTEVKETLDKDIDVKVQEWKYNPQSWD